MKINDKRKNHFDYKVQDKSGVLTSLNDVEATRITSNWLNMPKTIISD